MQNLRGTARSLRMTLALDGTRWADEPSDQGGRGQGRAYPITRSTSLPSRRSQSDNARPVYHHALLLHTAECLCPGRRRRRRVHPAVCRARHATRSITRAARQRLCGPSQAESEQAAGASAGRGNRSPPLLQSLSSPTEDAVITIHRRAASPLRGRRTTPSAALSSKDKPGALLSKFTVAGLI